jgi:formamidopyrimidine-DNA glycosylase
MPELPEVETVRRGLAHLIAGYTITSSQDLHPRVLKKSSIAPRASLSGARITAINRRGKFLWFILNRPEVLVAHLGMSGQFLINGQDGPTPKHIRANFELKKGLRKRELYFNDQRTFGWLSVENLIDGVAQSACHIALDPFDVKFDVEKVISIYRSRNVKIKTALLNQEIMSGVGNIYADESLWRARIHPESMASHLSVKKIGSLISAATEVMSEAIAQGGTSFDDLYININGESGFFERSLAVYGKEGQACPRCNSPIRRIVFANRSSHFCPKCQRRI